MSRRIDFKMQWYTRNVVEITPKDELAMPADWSQMMHLAITAAENDTRMRRNRMVMEGNRTDEIEQDPFYRLAICLTRYDVIIVRFGGETLTNGQVQRFRAGISEAPDNNISTDDETKVG